MMLSLLRSTSFLRPGLCNSLPTTCSGQHCINSVINQLFTTKADRDNYAQGTTVLCVRKDDHVVIVADGQVTRDAEIIKPNVKKVRRIGDGSAIGGFAGGTADALTLFERLEARLEEHPGQLMRAAVELAKEWRTDKFLRRLDAVMVVADKKQSMTITGNGDILEPHDGIIAIGSGGSYALAAARALIDVPGMDAHQIANKAMTIAADCCIYTNHNFTTESLETGGDSD